MKKIIILLSVILLMTTGVLFVSGAETNSSIVSYGLDVIAAGNDMALAGITGNDITFNDECFARAMNLSGIDYITITELPCAADGRLFIGSSPVAKGQSVSAQNIKLMTYESSYEGESTSSFRFSVNGSGYSIACNLYMLGEINYSPTVSIAPAAALKQNTFRDVKICGVMSAYDPEGDVLTYEIIKYPSNGRLTVDNRRTGAYTYTPDDGFAGTDSFRYTVRDKFGNYSAGATVSLSVNGDRAPATFSDMSGNRNYASAIRMTDAGVMSGMQVGSGYYFYPDKPVSRSEFLVMSMKAVGIDDVTEVSTTAFADDSEIPQAMKGYVALAYSKNYINGKLKDDKLYFRPDENITRAEAAVILSNIIGYAKSTIKVSFTDSDRIPEWADSAIVSLVSLGVMESPDGNIQPTSTVTRSDTARILDKTIQLIGK